MTARKESARKEERRPHHDLHDATEELVSAATAAVMLAPAVAMGGLYVATTFAQGLSAIGSVQAQFETNRAFAETTAKCVERILSS